MNPIYKLVVDGNDITNLINKKDKSLLDRLTVTDRIGMTSDALDFTLTYDGSYRIPPAKGVVQLSIGYDSIVPRNPQIQYGLWEVGTFIVDSVNLNASKSGGKTLQVSCKSMPQSPNSAVKSLQNSSTRYWQSYDIAETTFSDIVFEVCNGAGLKAEIHEELKDIKMPFTAQTGQTDAQFLTQICSIRDAKVKYNDDQVIIALKDRSDLPEILIDGLNMDIISYGWSRSTRSDIRSVKATYEDDNNKVQNVIIGSGEPQYIIDNRLPDRETATNAAKSLLAHSERGQTSLTLSIATQPNLHAESPIRLVNFEEKEINGIYVVEEVRSEISRSAGLVSQISAKQQALTRKEQLASADVLEQLTVETEQLINEN